MGNENVSGVDRAVGFLETISSSMDPAHITGNLVLKVASI